LGLSGGWSGASDKLSKEGLIKAIELGANIFDTADVYGFGHSERLLGWALREASKVGKQREDFVVVTKTGYSKGCARHGFDPLHMRHQIEMSLENLKTDYIDIYFFHHLDFGKDDEYLEGAIGAMETFKNEGKIRFIGLRGPHKFSLYRGKSAGFEGDFEKFKRLQKRVKPDIVSIRYNMITPTYDEPQKDIFSWAKNKGIGIISYKPLGQGLLLDKYNPENPPRFGIGDHRIRKAWFENRGLSILRDRMATIKSHFGIKTTRGMVQLCLKYVLSRDESVVPVVGFKNKGQIEDSLSTSGHLNQKDVSFIRNAMKGINEEIGAFTDFDKEGEHAQADIS